MRRARHGLFSTNIRCPALTLLALIPTPSPNGAHTWTLARRPEYSGADAARVEVAQSCNGSRETGSAENGVADAQQVASGADDGETAYCSRCCCCAAAIAMSGVRRHPDEGGGGSGSGCAGDWSCLLSGLPMAGSHATIDPRTLPCSRGSGELPLQDGEAVPTDVSSLVSSCEPVNR